MAQKMGESSYPVSSIHSKGFGSSRPLGSAQADRRVEVHVMDQSEMEEEGLLPGAPSNILTSVTKEGDVCISFEPPADESSLQVRYTATAFVSTIHSRAESTETKILLPESLLPGALYTFEVTANGEYGGGRAATTPVLSWNGSELVRVSQLTQSSHLTQTKDNKGRDTATHVHSIHGAMIKRQMTEKLSKYVEHQKAVLADDDNRKTTGSPLNVVSGMLALFKGRGKKGSDTTKSTEIDREGSLPS